MCETPKVSIIIPTYNSDRVLDRGLKSVEQQSYENIETIVVDNHSNDSTVQICRSYGVNLIQEDAGMAMARKIGARAAEGKYLYFIDSDMELTNGVVKECVQLCEDGEYDALIIPERNIGQNYWTRCLKFGKIISRLRESGNLRFLRSDVYWEVGGHDESLLLGEDAYLHRRVENADYRIGHIDSLVNHHLGSQSLHDILKKKKKYAKTVPEFQTTIRPMDSPPADNRANVSQFQVLRTDPIHAIGYILINAINIIIVRYYIVKDRLEKLLRL